MEVSSAMTETTTKRHAVGRLLDRDVMRPGDGWRHIGGPVWEHKSGARIHAMGVIRMPDKVTFRFMNNTDDCFEGLRFVRANGGNMKRGMMAWARSLVGA